jgi:hypothetical protein
MISGVVASADNIGKLGEHVAALQEFANFLEGKENGQQHFS